MEANDASGATAHAVTGHGRAALDHLLRLISESAWGDELILRGSMVMPAWVGDRARAPGDLDFVVLPPSSVPIDPLHPHPYVPAHDAVQEWPEAVGGAARYEMWSDGEAEFETRGLRAVVPPEGLVWQPEPEPADFPPYEDLLELVRSRPRAARGVLLDADGARRDGTWAYAYAEDESAGIRILIPWRAESGPRGEAQLDFSHDERLPEGPVRTAVPRGDGGVTVVRTASRALSLAWKLRWLLEDSASEDGPRCKDLYDAVLLAETSPAPRPPVPARLADVRVDEQAWRRFRAVHPEAHGAPGDWLARLHTALTRTA
ncbi:nucleotidyl transferase AbiEii/AbiGii toxin family protein [Streptomyces sp. NPDC001568]|uniref:nucleotidyl transferase AbiEii/AbiGii toxin family protein n=1 Tax=Streptomyces sp. NPDC001568 TaxID=3364588 RepID=UPI0036C18FDB